MEDSGSEVDFQDRYSDDDSDESFDELNESNFDDLSSASLGNVLRQDLGKDFEKEMDDDEFDSRMRKALDVICPQPDDGPHVPQDVVLEHALRRSKRKRVALFDMEVCAQLYQLGDDSDESDDERGLSDDERTVSTNDSSSGNAVGGSVPAAEATEYWPVNDVSFSDPEDVPHAGEEPQTENPSIT